MSQDGIDTWTVQPAGFDHSQVSAEGAVVGGMGGPYPIRIDGILVCSIWICFVTQKQHEDGSFEDCGH